MAEVFLASTVGAEGFSRPVAIKRVLPSFSEDATFSSMFVGEARISALLRHPNIVQVLDFDRDGEGRLYLVMELIEGKDLSDVLERGPLPMPVIVHVAIEALRGLGHAHEMTTQEGRPLGIVHRDVSPHNVLLSWDGAVKVSDFGIAKAMLASGAGQSGMIKGKPLYMAPEQVTAPETLDHRADLFAVGVMLYEMLTGQRLYKGNTHEEVLTDVIQVAKGWRQLTAPTVLRPDLPWDVSQVTLMLLAPDRHHRFASAHDAIDALLATSSASPRAGEMLAQLLAERFPGEAPVRILRRSGAPGVVTGPDGGTWVVTPAGQPGLAAGTPTPAEVQAAPTRTVTPPLVVAEAAAVAPAATVPLTAPAAATLQSSVSTAVTRRSRAPIVIGGVLLVAAAVLVTVLVIGRGRGTSSQSTNPAITADAAPAGSTADAGVAVAVPPAVVDAAVAEPVDAAPVVDVAPDAGAKGGVHPPKNRPKRPDRGSDEDTGTTIHEVDIGGT
ncbi:MAG: serine/threonine protein kinase [Kofleriaceae bacterium]|nr:serine/threonine protein kinase [Kofleriaceae bacterium]